MQKLSEQENEEAEAEIEEEKTIILYMKIDCCATQILLRLRLLYMFPYTRHDRIPPTLLRLQNDIKHKYTQIKYKYDIYFMLMFIYIYIICVRPIDMEYIN